MHKVLSYFFVIFFIAVTVFINTTRAEDEIEYYGTITSINYNTMTFIAGWYTFKASPYTEIEAEHGGRINFCYLRTGHYIKVEGWPVASYVDAKKIEVKNFAGNETCHSTTSKITVKGNISLIDINTSTIVVKNYTVKITPNTKFKGTASNISQLYQNQLVNVKGKLQTNGTVKATLINAK